MAEKTLSKYDREMVFGYLIYKHLSKEVNSNFSVENYSGSDGAVKAVTKDDFYFNVEIDKLSLKITSGCKGVSFVDYRMLLEDISEYGFQIAEGSMHPFTTKTIGDFFISSVKAEITRNFIISKSKYERFKKEGR